MSATGSAAWMQSSSSPTKDMQFCNAAVSDVIVTRLGLPLIGLGDVCAFCNEAVDAHGHLGLYASRLQSRDS